MLAHDEVLLAAGTIINGDRRDSYGDIAQSFANVAVGWSALLGVEVTPLQAALCMIWLKLVREAHGHKTDNLVDICGYAALSADLA